MCMGVCVVKHADGTIKGYLEVPNERKRKYYILVRIDEKSMGRSGLTKLHDVKTFGILQELINILAELVGQKNVVFISTKTTGIKATTPQWPHLPTKDDFIKAYRDPQVLSIYDEKGEEYNFNRGVIFNYGHGNSEYAGLIFNGLNRSKYLMASELETLVLEKNRRKLSKNYVCHQREDSKYDKWRSILPYIDFYSRGSMDESVALQLFVNHLVDEINEICPGAYNKYYRFKCTFGCIYEKYCPDITKCLNRDYVDENGGVKAFRDGEL